MAKDYDACVVSKQELNTGSDPVRGAAHEQQSRVVKLQIGEPDQELNSEIIIPIRQL